MPASRGNFQGAFDRRMPLYVGEVVRHPALARLKHGDVVRKRSKGFGHRECADDLRKRGDGVDIHIRHNCSLAPVARGKKEAALAAVARTDGDGKRAGDGPDAAIERKLPGDNCVLEELARDLTCRHEDADRYGQVEARAGLAYVGRSEVDSDTFNSWRRF